MILVPVGTPGVSIERSLPVFGWQDQHGHCEITFEGARVPAANLLAEEGVHPSAFIWVHANAEPDPALHAEAAARGAWVEFDGVGPGSIARHVELAAAMKRVGRLGRVLLSQDAGWYHVGESGGGDFRPYDALWRELVPALRGAGFTDAEVRTLTVDNPREAFTIRARLG